MGRLVRRPRGRVLRGGGSMPTHHEEGSENDVAHVSIERSKWDNATSFSTSSVDWVKLKRTGLDWLAYVTLTATSGHSLLFAKPKANREMGRASKKRPDTPSDDDDGIQVPPPPVPSTLHQANVRLSQSVHAAMLHEADDDDGAGVHTRGMTKKRKAAGNTPCADPDGHGMKRRPKCKACGQCVYCPHEADACAPYHKAPATGKTRKKTKTQ
ncbi:Aste57867_18679 [Aphanomyces stellatus]|uniref:Aste57867_18679 protein n=1 Tax=Aphanomyces stellatus TaxID=120398 RepID=A0A485LBB9_9STRA|nr:hypothetical protein As57867_018617 [Aphanomyces stellatus]VFT95414.1 Aste57867_18679 [Aphanomyces stellatus]